MLGGDYCTLNRKKAALSDGANSKQMLPSTTDPDSVLTVKGEFPGGQTVDDMDDLRDYMPAAGSASFVCVSPETRGAFLRRFRNEAKQGCTQVTTGVAGSRSRCNYSR